ncbi:MAG: alpha/beta fold hydrolase [Henriciella sp.]
MLGRHYLDNGHGGQLHYARAGLGPTIICLHQTPRSWDEYREVMLLLQDQFQIIAMDLPGMGGSSSPEEGASIEAYAKAVIKLVKTLACGPVILCGHHTGGVVAIEAAAKAPDHFGALVLSSTPWVDAEERAARKHKQPIDTVSHKRDGTHLVELWRQRSEYYPEQVEFMDRFIADAMACANPAEGHIAVGRYEMEKTAPLISCPILLVEHSQDPFACRHSEHLREAFPDADVERIPSGRIPLEATADQFAQIVRAWARQHFQTTTQREGVTS